MTDILHFSVDNSSLWSGAQCYVLPSLVITFEFYSFTAGDCLVTHKNMPLSDQVRPWFI